MNWKPTQLKLIYGLLSIFVLTFLVSRPNQLGKLLILAGISSTAEQTSLTTSYPISTTKAKVLVTPTKLNNFIGDTNLVSPIPVGVSDTNSSLTNNTTFNNTHTPVPPLVSPSLTVSPTPSAVLNVSQQSTKININTAGLAELDKITGVGPVIAQNIINYRAKWPFQKIEDIMKVSGIKEGKFDAMKDQITVGD
jgi:competence ComEA-like helix-hairpin-helix protein